jgi:hypothetical protein
MSKENTSDKPAWISPISDNDLQEISAGGGANVSLAYYDKNDLTKLIESQRANGPASQGFIDRLTAELESRSPDEPFTRPTVWISA